MATRLAEYDTNLTEAHGRPHAHCRDIALVGPCVGESESDLGEPVDTASQNIVFCERALLLLDWMRKGLTSLALLSSARLTKIRLTCFHWETNKVKEERHSKDCSHAPSAGDISLTRLSTSMVASPPRSSISAQCCEQQERQYVSTHAHRWVCLQYRAQRGHWPGI